MKKPRPQPAMPGQRLAVALHYDRKGAPRVVLHTAALNEAAQRFFERLGFRRTMIEMTRESSPEGAQP